MDIYGAKIVQDTNLYRALGISEKCGRKAVKALEDDGLVVPMRTLTGRTVLSFREAEAVMNSLSALADARREAAALGGSSSRVAA